MMKSEQHKFSGLHSSEQSIKPLPSPSQPSLNKKKYKGVRMRSWGSWVSEIRAPNQKTRIWLGSYSTPEAAARAYDAALICLKGSSASNLINFPLNASYYYHYLPLNHDHDNANMIMSPKSIQRVAAAAANATMLTSANHHLGDHHGTPSSSTFSSPSLLSSSPVESSVSELGFFDDDFIGGDQNATPTIMVNDPWIDLSPKYLDPMMNGMFFNPPSMSSMDEVYEEGDFSLWSFY